MPIHATEGAVPAGASLRLLDAWIPAMLEPGTALLLRNHADDLNAATSVCGMIHCPSCGQLTVVTEAQLAGEAEVVCGAGACPATFFLAT